MAVPQVQEVVAKEQLFKIELVMKLILVYNANTGFVNQSFNWLHKVVSPSTYLCSLCKLTHSAFGIKENWKNFIEETQIKMEFLHKDEFAEKYPSLSVSFPWIGFIEQSNITLTIVDNKRINQLKDMNELLDLLKVELKMLEKE